MNSSGTSGFGLALRPYPGAATPATGSLTSSLIEDSTTAGIWVAGSDLDLDGELGLEGGHDFSDEDLGSNACGCGQDVTPCKVLSANLTAPDPVEPEI